MEAPFVCASTGGARWDYVPSFRSGGVWLVCIAEKGSKLEIAVAFAPPGVALDDSPNDCIQDWRSGFWADPADVLRGSPAASIATLAVVEVHEAVPHDFKAWVLAATREQIDGLRWFADSATHGADGDPYARDASRSAQRLEEQLLAVASGEGAGDRPSSRPACTDPH